MAYISETKFNHLMKNTMLTFTLLICLLQSAISQVTKISDKRFLTITVNHHLLLCDSHTEYLNPNLYTTDGTAAGTRLLNDSLTHVDFIYPNQDFDLSYSPDYTEFSNSILFKNKLYFSGYTPGLGVELWVTDGTKEGTHLIKDIYPGSKSSTPGNFVAFNNILVFMAYDKRGMRFWRTDGTEQGTWLLKDLYPGESYYNEESEEDAYIYNTSFAQINNMLFFFAHEKSSEDLHLWKTDGTQEGTVLVKENVYGSGGDPSFGVTGNKFFFCASDENYYNQLWVSDGTGSGTHIVKLLYSSGGSLNSERVQFKTFKNKVFFRDRKDNLWESDGTSSGTKLTKVKFNLPVYKFTTDISSCIINNNRFLYLADDKLYTYDGNDESIKSIVSFGKRDHTTSPGFFLKKDRISFFGDDTVMSFTNNDKVFFILPGDTKKDKQLWITDGTKQGTKLLTDYRSQENLFRSDLSNYIYSDSTVIFSTATKLNSWKSNGTELGTFQFLTDFPLRDVTYCYINKGQLYFNATTGSQEKGFYKLAKIESTLPLTLLSFNASLDGKAVKLAWKTTNEINSSHFIVQRSADGIHFSDIGTVNAFNINNRINTYSFNDAACYQLNVATINYRLNMLDKDGTAKLSPVAAVNLLQNAQIAISPNPVKNILAIRLNNTSLQNATIRLINNSGSVVLIKPAITAQNNTYEVNVAGLAKGIYYAELITNNRTIKLPFVKE